jgi:hypothetical protein
MLIEEKVQFTWLNASGAMWIFRIPQ